MFKQGKVVMLGDSAVGKSTIVLLLVHNCYFPDISSSVGSSYFQKVFTLQDQQKFKLKIWDTAGQQRFRAFSKIYYKESEGAVLVYDITRKESFDAVKNWVFQINENCQKNLSILLLANKCDLMQEQQVSYQQGQQFANEIGAIFKVVSAKLSKGISQAFIELSRAILQKKEKQPEIERRDSIQIKPIAKATNKKKKCC